VRLAKVVGTVVATQKDPKLCGATFLVVEDVDLEGVVRGSQVVAFDAVGAGIGEIVLYASGSSARQTSITPLEKFSSVWVHVPPGGGSSTSYRSTNGRRSVSFSSGDVAVEGDGVSTTISVRGRPVSLSTYPHVAWLLRGTVRPREN